MTRLVVGGRRFEARDLAGDGALEGEEGIGENGREALAFARRWLAGDEAFVLPTSGSTGTPKPITLSRGQMEASARATGTALGLRRGQGALVCLPARYVAGRMMVVRGLVLGLDLTVVEPASDPFAQLPPAAQIDFASFVPLQMQTLLEIALPDLEPPDRGLPEAVDGRAGGDGRASGYRRRLDGMQAILLGGGPVPAALHALVRRLAAPVYHTYGMTETATHIALRRLNGPGETDAFTPLPGVALRVDERGCLAIRGPMTGGASVQTNDLAALRTDGSFVWLGRADNVINSGGVKVFPEKVEAAIEALQASRPHLPWAGRRLAVAGGPDARLGQVVTLVLEGAPLGQGEEEELAAALRSALDRFEAPRRFVYVAALPLTETGKIDRARVRECLNPDS